MKIECPECGYENYFTGLEDEYNRFCNNCGIGLFELDNQKITSYKSKIFLSKDIFYNKVVVWLISGLEADKKGLYNIFSKEIEIFKNNSVLESQLYLEIIYFYMFLIYFNCAKIFKNKDKVEDYFDYFVYKAYDLILKKEFGKYKKEDWEINLVRRLKDYTAVCKPKPAGEKYYNAKFTMLLTMVFCKNFPNKEELVSTNKITVIDSYLYMILSLSLKTFENYFKKYKI